MKSLAGKIVLLLEDEPMISVMIEDDLREVGAKVVSTKTCNEALHVLRTMVFDAAVLDLRIGVEDCREVAAFLQASGTPFIASTGDHGGNDFGAAARLLKPFSQAELVTVLRSVFDQAKT